MERRQQARTSLETPDIAIVRIGGAGYVDGTTLVDHPQQFFVDLLNRSLGGALLKSTIEIDQASTFHLSVYNPADKTWDQFTGTAAWVKPTTVGKADYFLIGASLVPDSSDAPVAVFEMVRQKRVPGEDDFAFFRRTELLRSLPREVVVPLINNVSHKKIAAGEQFITQGEPGDACFLIERGKCVARVEKQGQVKTVARLGEGSIVGEMSLLTGEPRSAHVVAETDMELWGLTRARYDQLDPHYPELRAFLTAVLTRWFDTREVIAERHIGKYTLTDVAGQGAYAIVYKGLHRDLGMQVAIKMMRHDMAMEAEFIDGFHQEAKTIAGFRHENIVKIYDIEEKYRTVFIIMEYLEGNPLRKIMEADGKLPPQKVVKYVQQICSGLQYAHRQQIVHQDIKPGNIFVMPDDQVKIVDFGLSVPCGTEAMMTGTPYYMSPEQIECLPVDIRADIFALGIMTYEMVTGARPFPEKDAWKVMDLHVSEDIPDPAGIVADIPDPLRSMILRACARDPEKRYQTIDEIIDELSPLLEVFDIASGPMAPEGNNRTTFSILHQAGQQKQLDRLMKEFKQKIEKAGMVMKTSNH